MVGKLNTVIHKTAQVSYNWELFRVCAEGCKTSVSSEELEN